jgi:hypothetical protein
VDQKLPEEEGTLQQVQKVVEITLTLELNDTANAIMQKGFMVDRMPGKFGIRFPVQAYEIFKQDQTLCSKELLFEKWLLVVWWVLAETDILP